MGTSPSVAASSNPAPSEPGSAPPPVQGTRMEADLLDLDTKKRRIELSYEQCLKVLEKARAALGPSDKIAERRRRGDARLAVDVSNFKRAAREFNQQAQALLLVGRAMHTLRMAMAARELAVLTSDAVEIQRHARSMLPASEELETQVETLQQLTDELGDTLDQLNARLEQDDGLGSEAVLNVEAAPVFSAYEASLLEAPTGTAPPPPPPATADPVPAPRPRRGPPERVPAAPTLGGQ